MSHLPGSRASLNEFPTQRDDLRVNFQLMGAFLRWFMLGEVLAMTEESLSGILQQFVRVGHRPTQRTIEGLASASGHSPKQIFEKYVSLAQADTSREP
jgi:hypothetical protein